MPPSAAYKKQGLSLYQHTQGLTACLFTNATQGPISLFCMEQVQACIKQPCGIWWLAARVWYKTCGRCVGCDMCCKQVEWCCDKDVTCEAARRRSCLSVAGLQSQDLAHEGWCAATCYSADLILLLNLQDAGLPAYKARVLSPDLQHRNAC